MSRTTRLARIGLVAVAVATTLVVGASTGVAVAQDDTMDDGESMTDDGMDGTESMDDGESVGEESMTGERMDEASGDGPGFTVALAVVAVLAAGLIAVRRRG